MSTKENFARHIILNGLPNNITPDKREKFQNAFSKKITDVLGHSRFNLHVVMDAEAGLAKGAFLSFATETDAETALAKLNMYHFTKTSIITTYRWSALENAKMGEEEYVPPPAMEEEGAEEDFLHNMAMDEQGRPQFIVKGGLAMDCEWYWFDWERKEPVLYRRPNVRKEDPLGKWSEMDRRDKSLRAGLVSSVLPVARPLPVWSTYGTMMISQQMKGLRIWGGRSMHLLFEVMEGVEAFMVSSSERYIVTKTDKEVSVWNMRTAKKIRTLGNLDLHSDDLWPIVRFSADDTLVAVCKVGYNPNEMVPPTAGRLSLYIARNMRLIQGSTSQERLQYTFSIPGLYKAEWNPNVKTQIAYVVALGPKEGWKLVIANMHVDEENNIATEEQLIQRHFLQATSLDMLWNPAGVHLSIKATLKNTTEYFLFHIGSRSVAAMQLLIKPGFSAGRFAWQQKGDYFATILNKVQDTNASGGAQLLSDHGLLQIHTIKNNKLKLLLDLSTSMTHLFWSPKGSSLVAVNFDKSILHFLSITDEGGVEEHNKLSGVSATDCQWDPTGRFFATWVSSLRNTTMAPQYRIFNYNGTELFRKDSKPFSHFSWRPLPPSLLAEAEVRTVKGSLRKLLADYEATAKEKLAAEEQKVARKKKDVEDTYTKRMNDLARKMRDQRLNQKKIELQDSSRWTRYWPSRIRALSEEQRIIHEDLTEERIISRRQIGTAVGSLA
ncbi:unnamed protein product [Phytomonas sp. Hart1]|nr:unnamed protein product [Phytomonas sp. Hart1]|eukprot:CCW69679.1 unnamed protein product [Phytomonas sp. isolate Hart1]